MILAILDDHPLIREGIKMMLCASISNAEINCFEKVDELIEFTKNNKVDIAITDLSLKEESGFEYLRFICNSDYDVKCIVFTSSNEYRDYKNAMEYHVNGYVKKDSLPEDLLYAIQTVRRGRTYIDPYFMGNFSQYKDFDDILTDRELDVFQCIGKGYNNARIAQKLFISINTVKKHIGNIFSKLEIDDRTEAVIAAIDYFGGQ